MRRRRPGTFPSPRRRRRCWSWRCRNPALSVTTTLAPSTSCSASSVRATAWPQVLSELGADLDRARAGDPAPGRVPPQARASDRVTTLPSRPRDWASLPAPCSGWPTSGPGRLPPGPCLLTGVSAETPGSGDFACTFTRLFTCTRCPTVTVTLETGGADTYTQRAIPGPQPSQDSCTFRPMWPLTLSVLLMVSTLRRGSGTHPHA